MSSTQVILHGVVPHRCGQSMARSVIFDAIALADHQVEKAKLHSLPSLVQRTMPPLEVLPACTSCNQRDTSMDSMIYIPRRLLKMMRSLPTFSPTQLLPSLIQNPRLEWPLPSVSENNYSLTDEEADALRTAIGQLETYIASRSTIPEPERRFRLRFINSNDVKLEKAHLKRLRGRLSIVHSLPPEIVREIFIMGADVTSLPGGPDFPNRRTLRATFGLNVAHVSRYWRNIALSTPELWSCLPTLRVEFRWSHTNVHKPTPALALYEFMLEHSGGCSLDISIEEVLYGIGSRRGRKCTRILDLLLDNSERWRSAILDIRSLFLYRGGRIKNKLSRLEALQLMSRQYTGSPRVASPAQPTKIWDIFSNAPKLNHVFTFFWEGYHTFQFPQMPQPLVSFVVHMNGHIGETALLKWAFESQNSVERLELYSLSPRPLPHNALFPRLRKLHIDQAFEGCLNAFTAPSLEELALLSCRNVRLLQELSDMLQRSDAESITGVLPLKRLTLRYPVDVHDPELIIKILEHTPQLVYLEMPLPPTSVLSRLAVLAPSPILPKLQHLIFRLCTPITYDIYYAVNTVARSRCEKPQSHEPNSLSESIEPIQLFALLPCVQVAAVQSKQDLSRSCYAFEDNWDRISNNMLNSAFGPSSTIQLPTKAAHLPEWAQAIDSCCPRKNCISEQGVKDWLAALQRIQWHDIDVRCYEYSRIFSKLLDLKSVLSTFSVKTKRPQQHILDLKACLEALCEKWKSTINAQLPRVHWVILHDVQPFLHALLYIPQHDDVRSTQDTQLIVNATSQAQGPLKEYYNMFRRILTFYALSENVVPLVV